MKRWMIGMAAALLAGGVWIGVSGAEEPAPAPGMQMPEWTQTNDHHKALAKFAGEWKVAATGFAATTTSKVIYGGRYVRADFSADLGPMKFEGEWTITYSNVAKTFQSIWIDNYQPHAHVAYGTRNEKGVYTLDGKGPNDAGQLVDTRMVITWHGDDKYQMDFHEAIDGKMTPKTSMVYERVKK